MSSAAMRSTSAAGSSVISSMTMVLSAAGRFRRAARRSQEGFRGGIAVGYGRRIAAPPSPQNRTSHSSRHTAQASHWGDSGRLIVLAPALAGEVPAVAGGVYQAGVVIVWP